MNIFRRTALMGVLLLLTACLPVVGSFPHPKITSVEVHKADRQLTLLSYGFVIRRYDIDLGSDPVGPKRQRGDGKTPEGAYHITHVNTQSRFTLSLGINYPNEQDLQIAAASGVDPGDEIFVHGLPNGYGSAVPDWTNGCVAVANGDIKEIVALVQPGTPITIYP
jgi:murein L,D-transpeptidase YafK